MEVGKSVSPAKKPPKQGKAHVRHRRPPKRLSRRPNDVYVNRKTEFGRQLARCHRLLEQGMDSLTIHGLGSAIHRAINLALQLQESLFPTPSLSVTTSTVQLCDDLEPLEDDVEFRTHSRPSSAIHIVLTKQPDASSTLRPIPS